MADNITLNAGAGGVDLATDDAGAGGHVQIVKLAISTDGSATLIPAEASNGLDVDVTRIQAGDNVIGRVKISDGTDVALVTAGGSLQVDASGAAVPVTDNSGSLTVDNAGTFAVQADTELTTADLDTGAGTDTRAVVGLVGSKSGGGELIPGSATDGLLVNLGANNDVTVTGTVTVDASGTAVPVTDNSGSLTVDAPVGTPVFVRLSDGSSAIATLPVSLASVPSHAVTNAGTFAVQVDAALPAGTNAIGKLAANSGVDIGDVDVLSIAAGTNNIGNVGLIPRTSGGMTIFKSIDIDESEEEIKATAGQVFSISAFNHTAAALFLKFYNAAAADVTVGTTTPVLTFTVPAVTSALAGGFVWNNPIGFAFSTSICVACTTAIADNDSGAPAANACSVMVGYA